MQRRRLICLCLGALLALASCVPTPNYVDYDETLLYGEWVEGTVHDTYNDDGSGYTWDTADDITEEEATPFNWNLEHDQLHITHVLWNGTVVPKIYTIKELNDYTLAYEDDYGTRHEYQRVASDPEPEPEPEPDPNGEPVDPDPDDPNPEP